MADWARVTNNSRGSVAVERCRVARSLRDRTVGLLGTAELPAAEGLWIERSPSIHMFFMRYPIDAVFVDRSGRVVRIVERLRPWRIVAWVRGARDCLEMPAGAAQAAGIQVGDELRLEAIG
ncbi:MAG: DUF192 domain-containing protein [Chloroflexota bacterium]